MTDPGPLRLAVVTQDEKRQANLVEQLEGLLLAAREGELETLMVVAEFRDSPSPEYWVSGSPEVELTIGRLEILKHGLVRRFLEAE